MKFAAKRTWPEKSSSWEHQGDADNIDAFAAEFATIEQLAIDSEFVVMTKEDDSPSSRFFRVAATSPYQLVPAESRPAAVQGGAVSETQAPEPESADADTQSQPVGMPSLSPVISMLFYMGKVGLIATVAIALMAVVLGYLKDWLG